MIHNILITILTVLISCSNAMNVGKWKIIKTKGIQDGNVSFDFMSFVNQESAFLFGSSYTDENLINKRFEEFDAVVYHSSDGGKNWHGQIIGKGKFSALVRKDNIVLATVNTGRNGLESGTIYSSDDRGITWRNVSYLKNFYIRNICLDVQGNPYIIGRHNGSVQWQLLRKQLNADVWDTVSKVDVGLTASPEIVNDHILYISMRDNAAVIHSVSLITGQTHKLNIADGRFQPYFINSVGNEVYVTGKIKDTILVYKYAIGDAPDNQVAIKLHDGDKFPVQLHLYKGQAVLLVGEKNTIGATYYLYYKNANNSDWRNISVPSSYFSPVAFCDNTLWGYSSDNQIYRLELSSQAGQ